MSVRYREVFSQMIEQNKEIFDEFEKIHSEYALNPDKHQDEYNEKGKKIQALIRRYEDILCGRSEKTGYGKYSATLAEKFHEEIKKHYEKIDSIGIISFKIGKINPK